MGHERLFIKAMCMLAEFYTRFLNLVETGHGLTSEQCPWLV